MTCAIVNSSTIQHLSGVVQLINPPALHFGETSLSTIKQLSQEIKSYSSLYSLIKMKAIILAAGKGEVSM
ncbi:MAG: hypothetical protein WC879_06220 [Melioribacteraceae bacterium]